MRVAVLLVGEKILQNHQHPVVALFHLPKTLLIVFVECSGRVASHHQDSAPNRQVKPESKLDLYTASEHAGIQEDQQHHKNDACDCCQRGMPPPEVIGGIQSWQETEDESHSLRRDHEIQQRSDQNQKQQ